MIGAAAPPLLDTVIAADFGVMLGIEPFVARNATTLFGLNTNRGNCTDTGTIVERPPADAVIVVLPGARPSPVRSR